MRHPKADHNPNTPDNCNKALEEKHVRSLNYGDIDRYNKLLKYYSGGSLLDVGCLNSPVGVEMKKKYPESRIVALDHGDQLIAHFKNLYPEVEYVVGDAYRLPFPDETFDYVVAGEILEHLDNPKMFVREAHRVLKDGGTMAISTPHEEWNREQGGIWHVNTFTIDEIKKLMKDFVRFEKDLHDCGAAVKFILAWSKK